MNYEIKESDRPTHHREIFWVCLYCETSNETEYHVCEVCMNERIYSHEEVGEIVNNGGFKTGKIDLNPWAIGIIALLVLLLILK